MSLKKLVMLLTIMLVATATGVMAQPRFSVAKTTGSFSLLSGGSAFTWTTTTANDDEYSAATNIGFNFTYCGTVFTQFQASTNGFIRLGTGLTSATATDALSGTLKQVLAPLWDDLGVSATATDVTYQLSGVSPNQILTVEWKNVKWNKTAGAANAQFQLNLYENGNKIEFLYGTITAPTSGSASIGLNDNELTSSSTNEGSFISVNLGGTTGAQVVHLTMAIPFAAITTASMPDANTSLMFTPFSASPYSGTLTVGGSSPTFATVSEMATKLHMNGISGPVTVNIRPGTYDDIMHLLRVPGSSASNTLLVQAESGTVTLSPRNGTVSTTAASSTTGDAIVRLDGTVYTTLNNLYLTDNTLNTTTTTKYDLGIVVAPFYQPTRELTDISGARFNVIRSVRVDLNATTGAVNTGATAIRFGTPVSTVYDTSATNSYNTIVDCKLIDFYRSGIRMFGYNNGNPDRGNKVTGDTGRTYIGEVNITTGATLDVRAFEVDGDQRDLVVEKTDIYNITMDGGQTTQNVYGFVSNLATGTTDFLVNDVTFSDVRIYSLYNQATTVTTGFAVGISINKSTAGATVTIKNCKINDLYSNGSGTNRVVGLLLNLYTGTGTVTANVYNNMIFNLRAPRAGHSVPAPSVRGIDLQASGGGNIAANVYNNTIVLDNSVAPTVASHYSTGIYLSNFGSSILDLRNNILSNTMSAGTGGTGAASAIYGSASTNLIRLHASSDNNIYYVGTTSGSNRIVAGYTGTAPAYTALTTLADFRNFITSTGSLARDLNSMYENVPFVSSTTDVHIQTGSATQVEGRGSVIAMVSTDIDGNTRSGSAPDIGADEGSFTSGDFTGPVIFGAVNSVANNTGTSTYTISGITITDPSGVNTTAGTKPRLYFKKPFHANAFAGNTSTDNGWKWVEADNASSPFSFTVDYSLLLDGVPAAGDTIYYFVVAQDNAGSPNVGSFTYAGFSGTSVSSITSAPTTSYLYYIANTFSGTVTVGSGGMYPTLSAAGGLFASLNKGVLTGDLTVNIVSDISGEDGTNSLSQQSESGAGNYSITIQSDAATVRTITQTAVIYFSGADRVTIDGRVGGSGKYLRFRNTSTASGNLLFGGDAVNCTLRNLLIENSNANSTNPAVFLTSGLVTGQDNFTMDSCVISDRTDAASTYGIAFASQFTNAVGSLRTENLQVTNNEFKNCFLAATTATAISLNVGTASATVSGNSFYFTAAKTFTGAVGWQCISMGDMTGVFTISGNYIGGNAVNAGGSALTLNSTGNINTFVYPIRVSNASTASASTISNNTVKNIVFNNTTSSTSAGVSSLTMAAALIADGWVNVTGNTIGDQSSTGSISITHAGVSGGGFAVSCGNEFITHRGFKGNVQNNTVGGVTMVMNMTVGSGTVSSSLTGILISSTFLGSSTVSGNTVGSTSVANSFACTSGTGLANTVTVAGYSLSTPYPLAFTSNTGANFANSSTSTGAYVAGLRALGNGDYTINSNTFRDFSTLSASTSGTTTASALGIYSASGSPLQSINNNTIYNLANASTAAINPTVVGILVTANLGMGSIAGNRVYNLTNTATGGTAGIRGVHGDWGTWNMYNNFISIDNGANTNACAIYGIYDNVSLPWTFSNNTIRISGSAATGTANSYGYYRIGITRLTAKNNIYFNDRANSGATGKHYAVANAYTGTLTDNWVPANVNYNNYYAATASTVGMWGAGVDQTLAQFQASSGGDANSVSSSVNFVSATDLHLTGASLGDKTLTGTPLADVTTDYDGDTRDAMYPYMGADENTSTKLRLKLNLTALIEGLYDNGGDVSVSDTVKVYLRGAVAPYALVDSATVVMNTSGVGTAYFRGASNNSTSYYLQVTHRSAIETWSAAGNTFATNSDLSYNFTTAADQAYGSNQVLKGTKYCIYSGDVNQDGLADLNDLIAIDNDNANFDYHIENDVNMDAIVDLNDMIVVDNNNAAFVGKLVPSKKLGKDSLRVREVKKVTPQDEQQ